jgi:hypothetical protein
MILRWLAYAVIGVAIMTTGMFVGARFMDGPFGMIPGGTFRSGTPVPYPQQWTFAEPIEVIEMQLEGADTSRNVWIVVHDERAYLPANLGFPPGKNWHLDADQDGAAQLRIETRLYDVALRRISDVTQATQVFASLEAKYPSGAPEGVEYWFFAVEPR